MWQVKTVKRLPMALLTRALGRHAGDSEWYMADFECQYFATYESWSSFLFPRWFSPIALHALKIEWGKRNPFFAVTVPGTTVRIKVTRVCGKMSSLDRLRLWWLMRGCEEVELRGEKVA